ncbi:37360_t:CDS:2, partial [Gigaspora margarita]
WAHSSVLIDNKLYFKGGNKLSDNSNEGLTNELFYLDVSKPFTTTDNVSITWINLTYTDGPLKGEATSCIGGKNNDILFEFGGYSPLNQTFVNQFDTSKQQWSYIESVGPRYRQDISCAKFSSGLIAIFSGLSDPYTINDLWIFNTLTLSWNLSNAVNSPPQRFGYCAITLPNENILYIGGRKFTDLYDNSSYMPMNILPLYNTKSHMWTNMGLVLCGHTATLVEIYMIVAFGSFVNGSLSSKLFMLDVSQKDSYRWVNEFTTNVTFPNNTIISDFKISNLTIGAITGSNKKYEYIANV